MEAIYNILISGGFFFLLYIIFTSIRSSDATRGVSAGGAENHGRINILNADNQFDSELKLAGSKPVIVDFTAVWCGPCQRIAPYFQELSNEFGDSMIFLKVDVDQLKGTSSKCGVRSMPTFHIFVNGRKTDELIGASPNLLRELVVKYAKSR